LKKSHRCWIHFIGKEHYSLSKFIKEARKIGVSRRIAPQTLKLMHWGDIILLARSLKQSCKIFGWFKISRLYAIGLKELFAGWQSIIWTPMHVEEYRQCGHYTISSCGYISDVDLEEVAKRISKEQRPMIGGELVLLNQPIKIKGLTFQRGFRPFDLRKLIDEYDHNHEHKGQYYFKFEPLAGLRVALSNKGIGFNMETYIKAGG